MRAVNARALAYPAQRRIAGKEIMGPHCGQHSTAYSTGSLLMSHLGSAPGVRGRARAAARGTPAYGAFSQTPWRKCGGAARSTSPPFAKACLCRLVGGRKGRSNRVVCDKVLGSFSAAMLPPSCTWQLVRLCCPGLFFYVRVSLRRGTIRNRYLRCVIIGQSLFCARRAE
jgi:hypothetical protein